MTSDRLPVVDFSMLNIADVNASMVPPLRETDKLNTLADDVMKALQEFEFCYLKNHGISLEKANRYFNITREAFAQPEEVKKKYAQRDDALFHGFTTRERERPTHADSVERYETFLVCPRQAEKNWMNEVVEFKPASLGVYYEFQELAYRVLDVLGIGLGLKDRGYFRRCHIDDYGKMRNSLYHSYPDDFVPQPGQVRFHGHCDGGTVTLLYQDSAGGLQVKRKSGEWMAVPYIPGTVIMLVGKLMQRWTSDRLKAVFHQVVIPPDLASRQRERQSLAFFPYTADDFEFKCLDGSDKYKAVNIEKYLFDNYFSTMLNIY